MDDVWMYVPKTFTLFHTPSTDSVYVSVVFETHIYIYTKSCRSIFIYIICMCDICMFHRENCEFDAVTLNPENICAYNVYITVLWFSRTRYQSHRRIEIPNETDITVQNRKIEKNVVYYDTQKLLWILVIKAQHIKVMYK